MANNEYGTTWWGRRWLNALSGIDYENRIPRGKDYADAGKVRSLRIDEEKGEVKARVTGHYDPFYGVKITLPPIDKSDVARLVDRLAESPLIVARLAARELSPEIADIAESLGIRIFPTSWKDLEMSCTCPDWAVPCKHIAAAIYKLSEEIDANPFLLFTLRGIDLIAEMESRGVELEKAVEAEMPSWDDLIRGLDERGFVTDLHPDGESDVGWLEDLRKQTFRTFKVDGEKIRNLFAEHPAGYIHGDLRALTGRIVSEAGKLVAHQMRTVIERTIPEYDEARPLIAINTWGQPVVDESLFWRERRESGRFMRQELRGPSASDPVGRGLHNMFSGFITHQKLSEAPRELEALYDAWLIAGRLVEAGAVVPQIYRPMDDIFAVRWIPAVMDDEVKAVTEAVGAAFSHVGPEFLRISKAPAAMHPLLLGEIVLGLFIQSYIVAAWRTHVDETGDAVPEHHALFGCEPVDCDGDSALKAVGMRLEGWVAPVFLKTESHRVKGIVIVHDWVAAATAAKREGGDDVGARAGSAAMAAMFGAREVQPEPVPLECPTFIPYQGADEAEEPRYDEAIPEDVEMPDFDPHQAVAIEMRFSVDGGGAQESVGLADVLDLPQHKALRFDCLKLMSRLSGYCPELTELLKNRASTTVVPLDELADLLFKAIPTLNLLGVQTILPRTLRNLLRPQATLDLDMKENVFESRGLFDIVDAMTFDWRVAAGKYTMSEEEFEWLSEQAGRIVRFRDAYMYVDKRLLGSIRRELHGQRKLTKAELIRAALSGGIRANGVRLSERLQAAFDRLFAEKTFDVPDTIQATLRPYQVRGYSWLMRNLRAGMGAIIADDMGLGKTLQVITVLEKLRLDGELDVKQVLVVVPTTLLANWKREIARFAPNLTVSLFYGPKRDLAEATGDVVLTTYGSLRGSMKALEHKHFRLVVIDEAQAIKNYKTAAFRHVCELKTEGFIAMSGTPVENGLMEFWSIMEASNPGILGSSTSFRQDYVYPIENDHDAVTADRFKRITAPFMMRRLKTDKSIIDDLPEKVSIDEYCTLTKEQVALYNEVVKRSMRLVEASKDTFMRHSLVLQMIMQLKQICNSPALFEPAGGFEDPRLSGKMCRLFDILEEMQAAGRKVLVFTQFAQMGMLLQEWIANETGRRPQFIHGGLKPNARQTMVDRFQNRRDENVMVLTLKAAGSGLNLTAASVVIHYDLWWNAAVETQATDRAYRIGQQSTVNVYRFISANTFEEKINQIIEEKRRLTEMTVATGESWIGDLSNEELAHVFNMAVDEEDEGHFA